MRTAKLDEIARQKNPALKSAVELLARGQVSAALNALQQQGRVKEIPNTDERVRAIAKSYVESSENTLIVSSDNASRELNVAVREELKANGTLVLEDHKFGVLVQRQDMTGAISARLDNARQIEFNASEHRHFDHGYAVTSHNSQGLTAERVLVHADTSVHPDLLNLASATSPSRAPAMRPRSSSTT
jgi:hypothetical protein